MMKKLPILLLLLAACWSPAAAREPQSRTVQPQTEIITADSTYELIEQLRNMPNIEVGKGITFRPKNKWFELTMRFRMQNLLSLSFDDDFTLTKTDARVKRLRLRFDGYIYSPKLVYSVQLGFTGYDTEVLPNGNMNIVRDAIVYYVPSAKWNIGFGQTKIKANRARINSSSALQFVDRSIVNSEFNLDRDFGFFGEYNLDRKSGFDLSAKGSVTLGEGRNWGSSSNGGMAYTGRLELYPLGRFSDMTLNLIFIFAKKMQTSAMKACFQIAECSFSYAKIQKIKTSIQEAFIKKLSWLIRQPADTDGNVA